MGQFFGTNYSSPGPQCTPTEDKLDFTSSARCFTLPRSLRSVMQGTIHTRVTASSNLSTPIIRNVQQARLRRLFPWWINSNRSNTAAFLGMFYVGCHRADAPHGSDAFGQFRWIKSVQETNREINGGWTTVVKSERERWRINRRFRILC